MIITKSGGDKYLAFAYAQAQGGKSRQEDAFSYFDTECFFIADGVSTCDDGAKAAQIAIETSEMSYRFLRQKHFYWRAKDHLVKQLFKNVSRAVYRASQKEKKDFATTLVVACFSKGWWWIGSIGDSRVYRLRDEKLEQITVDHAKGNVLNRWIAMEKYTKPEKFGGEFLENDVFLLTTDGLLQGLSDKQIHNHLSQDGKKPQELEKTAKKMVSEALEKDDTDNITVCIVRKYKSSPVKSIPSICFN